MRSYLYFLVMAVMTVWIAGCAATGYHFDASKLSTLTPGQTTLEEASRALASPPSNLYQKTDGTLLALWSFKISYVADALYRRKEALLQFGADGRLMRLVDSTNIPLRSWERQKLLGLPAPASEAAQWPEPVPEPVSEEENIVIPGPGESSEPISQGQ